MMERVLMSCGCRQVTARADKARCNAHPEGFPYRRSPMGGGEVRAWDGCSWKKSSKNVWGEVLAPMTWVRLTFEGEGSHKYWSVLAYDYCGDGFGRSYVVHFGRIGTKGQHRWKSFSSRGEMETAARKMVGQKLKSGYTLSGGVLLLNSKGGTFGEFSGVVGKTSGLPAGEVGQSPDVFTGSATWHLPGWKLVNIGIAHCEDCGGPVGVPKAVGDQPLCGECFALDPVLEPPAPLPSLTAPIAAGRFQTLEIDDGDDD